MAQATIPFGSVHEQQKWSDQLLTEYLNGNQFRPFMRFGELKNASIGDAINGVVAVVDALGNKSGTKINIPMRRALTGTGVVSDQTLEGNEEEMVFDNESCQIDLFRHAVIVRNPTMTEQRTAFDVFNEARPSLSDWSEERMNSDIINALTDTSRGRLQARYLYGKSEANYNATHATALANMTAANDKLTLALIKKLKDKAKLGDPTNGVGRIRAASMTMDNGIMKKVFVLFVGTRARRDLEADATFQNIQYNSNEARTPLLIDTSNFVGMVDGVLIYEIENYPVYAAAAAASADAGAISMCGAQGIAVVYGQRPWFTQQTKDYGAQQGVAINEVRTVQKLVFNSANYAVVNGYVVLS